MKLLPSIDEPMYSLLETYFNLIPKPSQLLRANLLKRRYNRLSMLKLFMSQLELKHCNNKIIITVYIYNRKKISYLYKIKKKFSIRKKKAKKYIKRFT